MFMGTDEEPDVAPGPDPDPTAIPNCRSERCVLDAQAEADAHVES